MHHYKFLSLLILSSRVYALEIPESGDITRQQEPVVPRIDKYVPNDTEQVQKLQSSKSELAIEVKSIRITGGENLENRETLQKLVADAIGKRLGFKQLEQLTERISHHLRTTGWLLAKAYLPKQDVTEGNILIVIQQGKLDRNAAGHSILIVPGSELRLRKNVIQRKLRYVISGDSLDGNKLERELMLLNDLPGIEAYAVLEKGKAPGTSQLSLQIQEGRLFHGNFAIDSFGNPYTGTWRGTLSGAFNDILGIGDQLTVSGTGAEDFGQTSVNYLLPIGDSGLQANLHYYYLSYGIGREFSQTNSQGLAHYGGGGLTYPVIRTKNLSLWAAADYTHKVLQNSSLGVTISDKVIDNGAIGFNGQSADAWLGGGMNQFSYWASLGYVDLSNAITDADSDRASAQTNGGYNKHNLSFARLQKLTEQFSFFLAGSGQLASKNLTSAEKFILGGPRGIRAYPIGEGSGDSGWLINAELRYDIPFNVAGGRLQAIGFFDTGHIVINEQIWKSAFLSNSSVKNQYSLSGAGIGLNFYSHSGLTIKGVWAHSIGNDPGQLTDGAHHSSDSNLFWFQSNYTF